MPLAVLLRDIENRLRRAGIETPDHDARMLVSESLGIESSDIRMAEILNTTLAEAPHRGAHEETGLQRSSDLGILSERVSRRERREPLQHILGHTWFRYIDIQVGNGVFIPRPETETVVQAGIDFLLQSGVAAPRIVDLCAGSGAIGLSLCKEIPEAQVWAVEASPDAGIWTARNRDRLIAAGDISPTRYQILMADATDDATLRELDGSIDLVISNPPYIPETEVPEQPEVLNWDPAMALYGGSADGLRIPNAIIHRAVSLLRPGGALVMEHDISQGSPLREAAWKTGFAHAMTGDDLTGRPRYLLASV